MMGARRSHALQECLHVRRFLLAIQVRCFVQAIHVRCFVTDNSLQVIHELLCFLAHRLGEVDGTNFLAERQDALRVDGKFVDAHAQEGFGEGKVRAEFAADADPAIVAVSGVDRHLDLAQYCRMVGIRKRLKLCVDTVDCGGVLGEVVRAEREEIDFFGEFISAQHGSRCLDHDADLRIAHFNIFILKLTPALGKNFLCLAHFAENMMPMLPYAEARSSARSWRLKKSFLVRQMRIAR